MEGEYEETMSSLVKNATVAEWAYETNVTDENQEVSVNFFQIIILSVNHSYL